MTLSVDEFERYKRQMMMEGWGSVAQEKLKNSTVFVAGAGGLGSPVAIYLAVAGVGHLRICDFDSPDLSNLNRQILHDTSRIGMNKAVSAKRTLDLLNQEVRVTAITDKITEQNAEQLIADSAIIVDCMDNFPTRYVLNRVATKNGIPLVHGAVWGMDGRLVSIHPPRTPCLVCLVPEAPPKEIFPVVGAAPGVIGSLQVIETLKFLTGVGKPLNEVLVWEGAAMRFRRFRVPRDPECPVCAPLSG